MRDSSSAAAPAMEVMKPCAAESKRFIDLEAIYSKTLEVFDDFDSTLLDFSCDDLAAPIDAEGVPKCGLDVPNDAWLSQFVEGSSSIEDETPKLDGAFKGSRVDDFSGIIVADEERSPASGLESSSTSSQQAWKEQFPDLSTLPGRARSKRSRTGTPSRKGWSADILDNNINHNGAAYVHPCSSNDNDEEDDDIDEEGDISSMFDDTSTTTTTRHRHSGTSFSAESHLRRMAPPPRKKANKGRKKPDGGVTAGMTGYTSGHTSLLQYHSEQQQQQQQTQQSQQQQQCLHCGSQKTPQWRTGPLGPKTLCNACGVRFKSGRLFPEYRPAASPSFVPQKHSNSHKRVLEMRKQKESTVVEFIPRQQEEQDSDENRHLQRVPRRVNHKNEQDEEDDEDDLNEIC